jgi:hypothetical protein
MKGAGFHPACFVKNKYEPGIFYNYVYLGNCVVFSYLNETYLRSLSILFNVILPNPTYLIYT